MKQESRLVTSTCYVCPTAGVTRLCIDRVPWARLAVVFVCVMSVFVLLKQLTSAYSLNLDMNIIQLIDTQMPYMPLNYNHFDILLRNKRKTDITCKLCLSLRLFYAKIHETNVQMWAIVHAS